MTVKHPQFLDRKNSQLVLIDVQEKLFAVMSEASRQNILKHAPVLLAAAAELKLPVVVTEQYPKGIGATIPELRPMISNCPVIEKVHFAATEVKDFIETLDLTDRKLIVLIGMETHVCVYQTALGLLDIGYDVHVVADALATREALNHEVGLQLMEKAGACVTTTETVLFQWLEEAGTESFKKLQKLVM